MLFFCPSRRRHTRCALVTGVQTCALPICPWLPVCNDPTHEHHMRVGSRRVVAVAERKIMAGGSIAATRHSQDALSSPLQQRRQSGLSKTRLPQCRYPGDRTSVVWGKSGSVRVDLCGPRTIKKKKEET